MKKLNVLIILSIILFIVGCANDDKDYFESAQESMNAEEYPEALVNYQKIVDEFPKSEHYKFALLKIGELNQGHVDKSLSNEESLLKSVKSYTKFHRKFHSDPKAPQTLFMIGFIQANELKNIEAAKVAYTKFLKLYPDSEMAESAKAEIENLGLTPDEILQKKSFN
jgi:TolA-binding protein